MSKKNCGVSRKFFFWNASASESQFASKILDFFDTSRVEEYGVFEWSISEYMGIVIHCWWYFVWEYFLKILGHIVWSLQTGTWHWRAFVVPISDLIHQRILQIFCLFVCLFGWINPGLSNLWDASTRGARSSPKTVLLSARKPPGEFVCLFVWVFLPCRFRFAIVTNDVIFLKLFRLDSPQKLFPKVCKAETADYTAETAQTHVSLDSYHGVHTPPAVSVRNRWRQQRRGWPEGKMSCTEGLARRGFQQLIWLLSSR